MTHIIDFINTHNFSAMALNGRSKIPGIKGWQKFCDEKHEITPDDAIENNIAICTGIASNIIVVDVDDSELFDSFVERHGYRSPKTLTVATGKGYHRYYRYPDDGKEYGNKSFNGLGFDIRGRGGCVVAPGSIHPDTGKRYTVERNLPIAVAPTWLLNMYDYSEKTTPVNLDKLKVNDSIKHLIMNGIETGKRSEAVMKVMNALVDNNLSDDQIFYIFIKYAIGDKYREKPANICHQWLLDHIDNARDYVVENKQNCTITGDNIEDEPEPPAIPEIGSYNVKKILEGKYDFTLTWLVDRLIQHCNHIFITGKTNVGKSTFTINTALRLAAGEPVDFFGYKITKPLKVVFMQSENPMVNIQDNIDKIIKMNPLLEAGADNIEILTFGGFHDNPNIKFSNKNFGQMLQEIHNLYAPDILIIDPYSTYSGVPENSNDDNRRVLDKLYFHLNRLGITAIIIHHDGKSSEYMGTDSARGASSIIDAAFNYWHLDRNDELKQMTLSCAKARNTDKFDDIVLSIKDGIYLEKMDNLYDPMKVREALQSVDGFIDTQGDLKKLLMKKYGVSETKSYAMIINAVKNGLVCKTARGKNGRLGYTVTNDVPDVA